MSFSNKYKIGFVGAGNMAQAIGFRLLDSGFVTGSQMIVSAPSDTNLKLWREKGAETSTVNSDVLCNCEFVFIAVKPQMFKASFEHCSWNPHSCYISIMAGISLADLKKVLVKHAPFPQVVRVMPNTPSMVGAGCSVICFDENDEVIESKVDSVRNMMCLTGTCDVIPESMMNAVSSVSGCGPAFIYIAIEALADGAVKRGVPRKLALKLAAQMVQGAARMVLETGKHPGLLKDEVCSPNGTTIAGVHELEKAGFRNALINAVDGATNRGEVLTNSKLT